MIETQRIGLAISAIERRRDHLQNRTHDLLGAPTPNLQRERENCSAQAKALTWALKVLTDGRSPEDLQEQFIKFLHDNGDRITKQRRKIAELVFNTPDYLSAQKIQHLLRHEKISATIPAIYLTLNILFYWIRSPKK